MYLFDDHNHHKTHIHVHHQNDDAIIEIHKDELLTD